MSSEEIKRNGHPLQNLLELTDHACANYIILFADDAAVGALFAFITF